MKIRRIVSIILVVLMLALCVPASFAEKAAAAANEKAMLGLLDKVWQQLDAVEADSLSLNAAKNDVASAVRLAALANELVDEGSVSAVRNGGFTFRVNGMLCNYNYTSRNEQRTSAVDAELLESITSAVGEKNGSTDMDVLLIGELHQPVSERGCIHRRGDRGQLHHPLHLERDRPCDRGGVPRCGRGHPRLPRCGRLSGADHQ